MNMKIYRLYQYNSVTDQNDVLGTWTESQMVDANMTDPDMVEWIRNAKVGEVECPAQGITIERIY